MTKEELNKYIEEELAKMPEFRKLMNDFSKS